MRRLDNVHSFAGMQKDLSVSKQPSSILYDGLNIRLTARGKDTLLSITNEISTAKATDDSNTQITIQGTYLGHCLLNEYLVVFSTSSSYDDNGNWNQGYDYITRLNLYDSNNINTTTLYDSSTTTSASIVRGGLFFDPKFPITAIPSYENKTIQKVYWVDGKNQPRMINIVDDDAIDEYNGSSFDFIQELELNEIVAVEKLYGAGGMFAPGVIQYAFTYYKKNGQESNIFYTTPLYYISFTDRGAAPDEKVDNTFKISVTHIDTHFDYLRIYSIQRTSLNDTPFVKRIQDIEIKSMSVEDGYPYTSYMDTGLNGDSVDPTELLYKGGSTIIAKTLEQKDNTLFLGNLKIDEPNIHQLTININGDENKLLSEVVKDSSYLSVSPILTRREGLRVSTEAGTYYNQLYVKNCAGFKHGNYYRLGVQFQYKTGKWSEPLYIDDIQQNLYPSEDNGIYELPAFEAQLKNTVKQQLINAGYRRARAVVVCPNPSDRVVLCQGVAAPTVYTSEHRDSDKSNDLYAQSSWFFRSPITTVLGINEKTLKLFTTGSVSPEGNDGSTLTYTSKDLSYDPSAIKQAEIQGEYKVEHRYRIDWDFLTLHSPDIEFDSAVAFTDFEEKKCHQVGQVTFNSTMSDIDIQTETPYISNNSGGFIHKSFSENKTYGIVSGLFYEDFIVDDWSNDKTINKWKEEKSSVKWMVYLWNKSGALNNDITRPSGMGNTTALLKKKRVSNFRHAITSYYDDSLPIDLENKEIPQVFNSDTVSVVKVGNKIYEGNIDTVLVPDESDGMYFAFNSDATHISGTKDINTPFTCPIAWKTFDIDTDNINPGIYKYNQDSNIWERTYTAEDAETHVKAYDTAIGDVYIDLVLKKDTVRMKYRSTPHIVFSKNTSTSFRLSDHQLPVVEFRRDISTEEKRAAFERIVFGGQSDDALRANTWIPCGEPIDLRYNPQEQDYISFTYIYGDTYYQRWDCLKTYPFTFEDENQVTEIGSFMLETYVNIDGRYDRNRGQKSNLNVSPQNFNLINPVYSQKDNFFTYRIIDDDTEQSYPNQITWTKEKTSGADVDLWTNITLASVYDTDGSKGEIISLNVWKDQFYCFQKKGVSRVLFNSRVQIPTSDGVPVEISNNYKMDGVQYISEGLGCNDQRLVKETPSGVYFIDSVSGHLYYIGGEGIQDISATHNMTSWFKENALDITRLCYDDVYHDLYMVNGTDNSDKTLCYSEILGQFTSFMSYDNISLIESCKGHIFTMKNGSLWKMFEGDGCCRFFDVNKPWSLTFASNGNDEGARGMDKTFTNLEFRACVEGDMTIGDNPIALEPFDNLEVWNEYQHGKTMLSNKRGHGAAIHGGTDSSLNRKFRIWRCDIPRDNAAPEIPKEVTPEGEADIKKAFKKREEAMGIYRYNYKPNDRMRNPWLYLKLMKEAGKNGLPKVEMHDVVVSYYV